MAIRPCGKGCRLFVNNAVIAITILPTNNSDILAIQHLRTIFVTGIPTILTVAF